MMRFLLILLLAATPAAAQPLEPEAVSGTISGTVVDSWQAEPIPGAVVSLRGTTLATRTGSDGAYTIANVPPATYTLVFSKSGYASATVPDVKVAANQISRADAELKPQFHDLEPYEVTVDPFAAQSIDLLDARQRASSLMDAIGSDMLRNLAASDAAGALSKVTGASVADGKYAVIRGLADRYTFTTMNGMELPSADPDRKAFQLDLMPAKFIEKVDVRKTFTPDMSGGFAGGSIDIGTKSYPDDFLFEFRVSTAYNTQSSLRGDFPASNRGDSDGLGFDDGTRAMPDEVASRSPFGSQNFPDNVKGSFRSSQLAPGPIDSPLNVGMEFLAGDAQTLLGKRVGYLAGFNYKNEYRFYDDGAILGYDQGGAVTVIDKTVAKGVIEYQWGALASLGIELSHNHALKYNFLRVQSAEDEASRATGRHGDLGSTEDGTYLDQSILRWTERTLTYNQLAGEHDFPDIFDVEFDWGIAYSTTTQDDPDFRIFQFLADPNNSAYSAALTGGSPPNNPTRYWRELEEVGTSWRGDLKIPVPSYNAGDNFLKAGTAVNRSERDYFQRGILALQRSLAHPFNSTGDPNVWMAEDNLPFINVRNFPANLSYRGEQEVEAAYLMADWAAFDWLQLVGGARHEATTITVDTFNLTQNRRLQPGRLEQNDWLPSLSAKLQFPKNVDLRAGWSRTVARPTYREIAPVAMYDVYKSRVVLGNPELQMSASENLDLRASWYPRPGEILSASVFTKRIDRPIELSAVQRDNSQITYENFDQAEVFGVEAELQMKLDRLWKPLDAFTLGFNAAYIESEVPLTEIQKLNRVSYGETLGTRPLYDQPTYILNTHLTWDNPASRTTVTLSGGVVGQSLTLVGLAQPDEYAQPAPELNLYVRQGLGKHWDVRFTARNLLNPAYEVAQTWPDAGRKVLESYTKGITLGLSIGCEF